MQPSFDKLPYRNNIDDTIQTSRGVREQCNQGWICSDDAPAKSSDLAVAPVTAADKNPGIVSRNGALTFNLSKLSVFDPLRKRSQPI